MIDINKKYKTRCGRYPVRIYCTDAGGFYPVHAAYYDNGWVVSSYTEYGVAEDWQQHGAIDLIEVNPYEHIKIDDMVIVWDDGEPIVKYNRHFAGISSGGKPLAWDGGQSSFTSAGSKTEWDNCKLFEELTNG